MANFDDAYVTLNGGRRADSSQRRKPCQKACNVFLIARSPLLLLLTQVAPTVALAQELPADERARETEQKMTDDERFGPRKAHRIVP